MTKTYNRIRRRYNRGNIKLGIQKCIQFRLQCRFEKLVTVKGKNPIIKTDTPGATFEKISMDIVGKLPITSSQNQYILIIQDNFTKYFLAIPLPNHQAGTTTDAFVENFICIHGSRKAALTDQEADFLSNLIKKNGLMILTTSFENYCLSFSIEWIFIKISLRYWRIYYTIYPE